MKLQVLVYLVKNSLLGDINVTSARLLAVLFCVQYEYCT